MGFNDFQQMNFYHLSCEIHYWYKKSGSNKYVILLHGAGCDHVMFEKQIDIFNTYNIIAWDARGHGLSKMDKAKKFSFKDMYDDCLKLLEIHAIEKAVFIGQSMGGNLAQEIAYHNHKIVEKLILIDCTKNTQKLNILESFGLKISRFILKRYPWKALVRQSANACGNTEYTKRYVGQCFEKMDKDNFIDIMMSVLYCLHEDQEYQFKQPVLLICGKNDITGNIRKAMTSWPKNDGTCKLCMIENAGHNSNQDNPAEVNKNILLFIQE
jgi:pimeloyl-ACP methyl ester carboxylesterase